MFRTLNISLQRDIGQEDCFVGGMPTSWMKIRKTAGQEQCLFRITRVMRAVFIDFFCTVIDVTENHIICNSEKTPARILERILAGVLYVYGK